MRIAIVGASGNIGTALVRHFATRSGHSLVGLSRRPPARVPPYDNIEWFAVDIASGRSNEALRTAFAGVDVVVHLAIGFQPMRDREYLRRTNVGGVERVAQACAAAGVTHLVHLSSGGIYAPGAYGVEVDESWPRTGVRSSTYSMDKAAAELVLDEFEAQSPHVTVARVRPGLVSQYEFGSAILRYALPDIVPSAVVDRIPLLPIDRSFIVPAVHSSDVADAVTRIVERRAAGPFNIAAPTPVRAQDVADAFGARIVPVPHRFLSAVVRAGFASHLQAVHHGWVDLAFETPLLDTTRARAELDWTATVDGPAVLHETIRGMQDRASAPSPALRRRTALDRVRSFRRRGFVSADGPS